MTYQRKRKGQTATFYPVVKRLDNRGNEKKVHDEDNPIVARVWVIPQRGAKAEVTGQQTINVLRIGVPLSVQGLALNARVLYDGRLWDIVSPPAVRLGPSRHTAHQMMDIRERP